MKKRNEIGFVHSHDIKLDSEYTSLLIELKQWYLYYKENQDAAKLQPAVAEFSAPFAYVPWGHHAQIIQKCKTVEEALVVAHQGIDS